MIAPEISGGFGSKSPYPVAHQAARLAGIAVAPVPCCVHAGQGHDVRNHAAPALIRIKSGFTANGRVVAWECHAYHAGDRPFLGRRGSESPYDTLESAAASSSRTRGAPPST